MRVICAALIILATFARPASAEPITFQFDGELTSLFVKDGWLPALSVGSTFTVFATFDPETVICCGTEWGNADVTVLMGGYTLHDGATGIRVADNLTTGDHVTFLEPILYTWSGTPFLVRGDVLQIDLVDPSGSIIQDPFTFPSDLTQFSVGTLQFIALGVDSGGPGEFTDIFGGGTITRMTLVPEPSTALLLLTGMPLLAARRRYL